MSRTGLVPASLFNPASPLPSAGAGSVLAQSTTRNTTLADTDLSRLNIDQLTALVGKAQSEVASREKQRRKDLRSELERRLAADGYKLGDIFPELPTGAVGGRQHRKMPVKFRNPQNPDETWTGIGRSRGGCRRSWASGASIWRRSRPFQCTASTPRGPLLAPLRRSSINSRIAEI